MDDKKWGWGPPNWLLALVATCALGCAAKDVESITPEMPVFEATQIATEAPPIAFKTAAAQVPRFSERCEGQPLERDGERCLTIIRRETAVECRYEVNREGPDENGHEGKEVEVTTLQLARDGSFHYRFESRGQHTWVSNGRQIETEGTLESEYRESADGVGECQATGGGTTECERDDVIAPTDPCTAQFLG